MNRQSGLLIVSALTLGLAVPGGLSGQETVARDLSLLATYLKSSHDPVTDLPPYSDCPGGAQILTPTTFSCPVGPKSRCTVRVELSLSAFQPLIPVIADVQLDFQGSLEPVFGRFAIGPSFVPTPSILLPTSVSGSYSWFGSVGPGDHTAYVGVCGDSQTTVTQSTLTLEVYSPPAFQLPPFPPTK